MSFLDNLENNLKSLESQAGDDKEDLRKRQQEREDARAAAPHAHALREGRFAKELMDEASRLGFARRTLVRIAWLDTILRLEAREKRLELRPSAEGVSAVFIENGDEISRRQVDLNGSAAELAAEWLS